MSQSGCAPYVSEQFNPTQRRETAVTTDETAADLITATPRVLRTPNCTLLQA